MDRPVSLADTTDSADAIGADKSPGGRHLLCIRRRQGADAADGMPLSNKRSKPCLR
jgi:hypothetical protein